ncbi:hypothetical protein CANCADRAFT_2838 [Tortispora caseinolytica NRRL Y-17796]|uniref:Thioredoxin domain-containing protein n=1 Tax=Tortispora caseinolytica NRRL Y-17796 TaxID=767744 RepID=A0A1E4TH84_9ASCO|nr:hypothetical protein CANCADRAFT_2838 [Tortispora caseinolytica NRRL Y-17796]
MGVTEIKSDDQFEQILSEFPEKLIAVNFFTDWAAPCKPIGDVFASIAQTTPDVVFVSVDADALPNIAEAFDVSAVPYFIFLQNRTIIKEVSGADPKQLVNGLQAALKGDSSDAAPASSSDASSSSTSSDPSLTHNTNDVSEETPEQLNARLAKLVKAAPVMLFMKGTPAAPQCGFSRQLVAILREHNIRFGFFDILKDDAVRQGLKTFSDWPTFPQLYINGELAGGLDIIKDSLEQDPDFFKTMQVA